VDELDFSGGQLTTAHLSLRPDHGWLRRVLAVVSVIGLLSGLVAIVVEHEFWWLKLAGRRATAQVTVREERLIGWMATRRSAAQGLALPITDTEFRFAFTDHAGGKRLGSFQLNAGSEAFRVGEALEVMYSRFGDGPGYPSALSFYAEHDPVWFSFTLVGIIGLVTSPICWWWRSRIAQENQRDRLAASPPSESTKPLSGLENH
jgi:hypothetical protein